MRRLEVGGRHLDLTRLRVPKLGHAAAHAEAALGRARAVPLVRHEVDVRFADPPMNIDELRSVVARTVVKIGWAREMTYEFVQRLFPGDAARADDVKDRPIATAGTPKLVCDALDGLIAGRVALQAG